MIRTARSGWMRNIHMSPIRSYCTVYDLIFLVDRIEETVTAQANVMKLDTSDSIQGCPTSRTPDNLFLLHRTHPLSAMDAPCYWDHRYPLTFALPIHRRFFYFPPIYKI